MENLLKQIEELRERIAGTAGILDIEKKRVEAKELKMEMGRAGFWNDREHAVEVGRLMESLESEAREWDELEKEVRELEEFVVMVEKEAEVSREKGKKDGNGKSTGKKKKAGEGDLDSNGIDAGLHDEMQKKFKELEGKFQKLEFRVLFSGKYDSENAILSIHAGTGGTDAQDWAQILERMFLRFAEKKKWKAEI
ncbi:MAG: PCRF domain-containing protein, partial [Candidatus Gracilibacteria bacterium]